MTATESATVSTSVEITSAPAEAPATLSLTPAASVKVRALLEQEGRDDLRLRVAVQPGGCSGMQYQLFFDERSLDGDVELDLSGVPVVVDRMSAPYLGGASIDFTDTIEQQGFTIDNPNASGGCACGNSFCG
jgi:iron-sulfur cluster assembly accessory protein